MLNCLFFPETTATPLKTHQTKLNLVDTEKENEEIEIISKIPRFQGLLPPQKTTTKKRVFSKHEE